MGCFKEYPHAELPTQNIATLDGTWKDCGTIAPQDSVCESVALSQTIPPDPGTEPSPGYSADRDSRSSRESSIFAPLRVHIIYYLYVALFMHKS